MTQPYLYLRDRSSAHSQVAAFKEIDRQLIQIGSDFGSINTTDPIYPHDNRIVQWGNDLYAITENEGVWKYDVANSGDWGLLIPWSTPNVSTSAHIYTKIGFTPCSINGSGVLVCGYPSSASAESWRFIKIFQDGTWSEGPSVSTANSDPSSDAARGFSPISYRNNLVFAGRTRAYIYDLELDTFTQTNPYARNNTGRDDWQHPLCVFKDRVFTLAEDGNGVGLNVLNGAVWSDLTAQNSIGGGLGAGANNVGAGSGPGNYTSSNINRGCLMPYSPDGEDGETQMVALFLTRGADFTFDDAFDCCTLRPNASLTTYSQENTRSMLGGLGSRPYNNAQGTKFFIRRDLLTNGPAGEPIYQLEVIDGQGANDNEGTSSIALYDFPIATTGVMTLVAGGLDARRYSHINNAQGTNGEFIWSGSGTTGISSPVLSLNGANIDAKFKLYGANTAGLAIQILFDIEGEQTHNIGTIAATSSGTIVGKSVQGLTFVDGAEITISWAAAIDGVTIGDNPTVAARVYVP